MFCLFLKAINVEMYNLCKRDVVCLSSLLYCLSCKLSITVIVDGIGLYKVPGAVTNQRAVWEKEVG